MTQEALELVQRLPREEWSDGYLVMLRVLKHYDSAKSKLSTYFSRAMHYRRLDNYRRNGSYRVRRLRSGRVEVRTQPLGSVDLPAKSPEKPAVPQLDPNMTCLDLYVRGYSIRQISELCNMPEGSVKSTIWRDRRVLSSRFQGVAESPSGGGCILTYDKTIRETRKN